MLLSIAIFDINNTNPSSKAGPGREFPKARIARLRAVMRQKISTGMSALESRCTNKMDEQYIQVKKDLEEERVARTHWVLEHGLQIFNRIRDASFDLDRWTCKRTADNVLVQLDYIIGMLAFVIMCTWNDYQLPIGVDHRCDHCILMVVDIVQSVHHRRPGLKHWMPNLDRHGIEVFQGKLII